MNRKPNTTCAACQTPIYRRPFQIAKGRVFCSTKCSHESQMGEPVFCKTCNKRIPRRLHKKTCSRECANKSRTGIKYKIGAPNNKASKNKIIRDKLLAIRPNKCNRCPYDKTRFLVVHHIIERSKGGSDDLTNLELLCSNCHVEHHNGRDHID